MHSMPRACRTRRWAAACVSISTTRQQHNFSGVATIEFHTKHRGQIHCARRFCKTNNPVQTIAIGDG
jgi:hypothetical protein